MFGSLPKFLSADSAGASAPPLYGSRLHRDLCRRANAFILFKLESHLVDYRTQCFAALLEACDFLVSHRRCDLVFYTICTQYARQAQANVLYAVVCAVLQCGNCQNCLGIPQNCFGIWLTDSAIA